MRPLLTSLCTIFFSFNIAAQSITLNWQAESQPVPALFRPGIFLVPKTVNGTNDLLNNGIQCNAIRTIDIETAMNHSSVSSINDVMARLEVQKPNILLANSRADKLILPIMKMPAWLSSSSDTTTVESGWAMFNAVPPANYTLWNTLMDSIVSKINDQWGLDPYYEIWNEPDGNYWQGSIEEYFILYKNTLQAIKSNHPNAKVGGPTVSNFTTSFTSSFPAGFLPDNVLDQTIIGQVIDSCVQWGTPMDFISWHKFNLSLYAVDMEINYLNQKLMNTGHGTVLFLVSEWNLPFTYRESPLDASFMLNYTKALTEHNISGQMVAAWQDFSPGSAEFHQDYGLLSWGALHKPSWKSLLLLNNMEGQMINTDHSDYRNLSTVSSYHHDTIRVLVSNFTLPGVAEAGLHLFFENELNMDSLLAYGYQQSTIDSILQGFITLSGTDPLATEINDAILVYQNFNNYFQNGRDISLKFPGITGVHPGRITIIDSTNNNVIYVFDSLINIGYTRTNAVNYLYPNNSFNSTAISLTDSIYDFHLQANGVALVEFFIPGLNVSTEELNTTHPSVTIYPNPTSDIVNIKMHDPYLKSITIMDSFGKCIMTSNNLSFSVKDLSNGVYFIIIQSTQGTVVRRLIKA
jgi:hypothetical protein